MGLTQGFAPARKTTGEFQVERVFCKGTPSIHSAALVQQFALFSDLSPAAYGEIVAAAHVEDFSRRQTIFFQDEPIRKVMLLTSGSVKSTQVCLDGAEVILRLSGPGDLVGAPGFTPGRRHRSMVLAIVPSRALVWNASVFEALLGRFPVLRLNAARIQAEHFFELEERYREISTEDVALRVGHELSRLVSRIGEQVDGAIKINLSREELAQLTGTTLFTVSRLLSQWKEQGMVTTGREFVLVHDLREITELSKEER